tara:strand:- start:132 stop:347 length:216 start_codon:yes stop_codon:yes gene_type:complete
LPRRQTSSWISQHFAQTLGVIRGDLARRATHEGRAEGVAAELTEEGAAPSTLGRQEAQGARLSGAGDMDQR